MYRSLFTAFVLMLPLVVTGCAQAQGDEQTLVDRATLTVQEMMNQTVSEDPRTLLRRSKGVMICPRVFKAGFIVGGEGGGCVLMARAGNGTWSYPAFYGMGSGSFGLQIGVQDSQILMLIMTDKGLNAVMDSQFTFGADASIAVATVGAGVQGSTTAAVGADIVAFAATRGLFGGIALEGSILSSRSEWNRVYYGQAFGARQIVVQMQASNPGADPLREVLTRYGAAGPAQVAAPPRTLPRQQAPGYAPAYPAQGGGYAAPSSPPQGGGYAPPAYPAQGSAYGAPNYPSAGASVSSGGRGPIQEAPLSSPR